MGLIPEQTISEIRDRTDIVAVIGEYVSLRKSGVNHKGLCPFHSEKSPSFNVNSAKQIFHCFGCGKSGDVFRFMMEHDGRPFVDVVRDLGKRAGVEVREPERSPAAVAAARVAETERAKLLRTLQLACEFFRTELASPRGEAARAYLDRRGIGEAVRERFLLGHAPSGWDGLVRFLEAKKVPAELAERAGLIRARERVKANPGAPPTKATHFDLFRQRVIFPLINPQGEVIAFGGRTLESDPEIPKYINSPETTLYRKGANLYGLHAAKGAIRKAGRAILVEGNFDVLMMHERGLEETIAPMGTALTPEQVHLLHRYSPGRVYLFLDGDRAGVAAAARGVGVLLDEEQLSYVAELPAGEDPDTFVAAQGRDGVDRLFEQAKESVEFFCAYAWKRSGASIVERVKLLEEEAAPLIRKVKNETARRRYAERLALELDLPLETVGKVLRGGRPVVREEAASSPVENATALTQVELDLVALLADHSTLLQRLVALGALRCVRHPALESALSEQASRTDRAKLDVQGLADRLDPALRPSLMRAALSGRYQGVGDAERALMAILQKFDDDNVLTELKQAHSEARAAGDPERIRDLTMRIGELNRRRLGLKD